MVVTGLSTFSGVGMLDEGVRAAVEYLGADFRSVGYIEREAYPASVLLHLSNLCGR